MKYFNLALEESPDYLEAHFGLARLHETFRETGHYNEAVEKMIYDHSDFVPAMIEKCRANLNLEDFNMLKESYEDLLHNDKKNIIGYMYQTLYLLIVEGSVEKGSQSLERLYSLINDNEPNNFNLYYTSAKVKFYFFYIKKYIKKKKIYIKFFFFKFIYLFFLFKKIYKEKKFYIKFFFCLRKHF